MSTVAPTRPLAAESTVVSVSKVVVRLTVVLAAVVAIAAAVGLFARRRSLRGAVRGTGT